MNGYELVRLQPNQLKKTGDTMTGDLKMSANIVPTTNNARDLGSSSLAFRKVYGSATSADKLTTARGFSINGIKKTFNGESDVSWSLAEIGAAATNHNQASNTITAMTGYTKGSSSSAIASSDTLNQAIGKLENKIDSKANSTHTHNYAGSATAGGSATSAVKLQTPRNINGVAFDGTKDITVADNTKLPLTGGTISGNILCNANNTLKLGSDTARFNTIYSSILDLGNSTGVYSSGNYRLTLMCGRKQGGEGGELFFTHNGTTYHFEPKWPGEVALEKSTGLGRSDRKWRDVWSYSGTLQTSDITMKENVKKVVSENGTFKIDKNDTNDISNISSDSIFETVKSIQPITFNYKGSQNAERTVNGDNKQDEYMQVARQLGISAQELEKINPALFEYVGVKTETENEAGEKVQSYSIKTLAFSNMILVALQEEIKYRDKQIELLEEKIKALEKKVDSLVS